MAPSLDFIPIVVDCKGWRARFTERLFGDCGVLGPKIWVLGNGVESMKGHLKSTPKIADLDNTQTYL